MRVRCCIQSGTLPDKRLPLKSRVVRRGNASTAQVESKPLNWFPLIFNSTKKFKPGRFGSGPLKLLSLTSMVLRKSARKPVREPSNWFPLKSTSFKSSLALRSGMVPDILLSLRFK